MSALAALLDLALPRRCVGCGSVIGPLCPLCVPAGPVLPVDSGEGIWAAAPYDGAVRAALLAYKERGRRDLARPLADLLCRAVRAAALPERSPPDHALAIVPVPSARSVAAARGGDHVARLARRAAAVLGVRVARDALVLARAVRDSAGLHIAERSANLAHAMTARPGPGLAALVVDDIVTTGATLHEARRALEAAGWPVVGAAVVAATQRRVGPASGRPGGLTGTATGTRASVRTT